MLEDGNSHFRPEDAQVYKGRLPVAFNGRIEHEGKADWFRFHARTRASVIAFALTQRYSVRHSMRRFKLKAAEGTKSRINITADDSNLD